MKPTVTILIGAPLSGDEARFLQKLHADLSATGALILANFVVDERQIDFVVVTPTHAALLELKNFPRPFFGDKNGVWKYRDAGGNLVRYAGMNPWQQTLKQKYALSDAMKKFQTRTPAIPAAAGAFYAEFAGFVCVYPAIHAESRVTAGDRRVAVRSYASILGEIRNDAMPSTWTMADWERFAQEHLSLTRVSLQEATDSRILEAQEALHGYRERVRTILSLGLPPLIDGSDSERSTGTPLIARLLQPTNFQLVGPSGSAKTFHLHHCALAIAERDAELPLLVEAARYRGGEFWSVLRQSTAPFFRDDPKDLLDAMRLCGVKPVLLIDAFNECSANQRPDLLRGIQAFALRFDCRIVLSSQFLAELAADTKAEPVLLELPTQRQKRLIYAYHAGIPPTHEVDRFCAGFTNAYDLTVAGRSHSAGSPPASRVDLYDRYVRQCLPSNQASLLTGLLRALAAAMSEAITFSLSRSRFDAITERFLVEQNASISLIDTLTTSRLARLTEHSFAFEHELLTNYFRAEALRRITTPPKTVARELMRPLNQDLVEYIVPRLTEPEEIAAVLASTTDVQSLSDACAGRYGATAQGLLIAEAEQLLDAALADIPHVTVKCNSDPADDGRIRLSGIVIEGVRTWTARDVVICDVISRNLADRALKQKFLSLLDLTEWTLRSAIDAAALESGFLPEPLWEEVVRLHGGVLMWGTLKVPCTAILTALRNLMMQWYQNTSGIPIREELLQRVNRNSSSSFALLALLQDRHAASVPEFVSDNIDLVRKALASNIYILQVDALEFAQYMSGVIHREWPGLVPQVREMLQEFDADNIMTNTARLEALTNYDGLDIGMTGDDAAAEMRGLIASGAADDPQLREIATTCGTTPRDWLAAHAYGCLGKIFEDIFQGVYGEGYELLSDDEKSDVLTLAASAPDVGWLADWMLQELMKVDNERAVPVYKRFASGVLSSTAMLQEAVAAYELGIAGCARWLDAPPAYAGDGSPAHEAWRIIGEVLFWTYRGPTTHTTDLLDGLWNQIDGQVLIAAGEVVHQLAQTQWRFHTGVSEGTSLSSRYPQHMRRIALAGLSHRGAVPSIFPHPTAFSRDLSQFLVTTLGKVGTEADVPVLLALVEDAHLGRAAISATEQIKNAGRERASVGN